MPNPESTSVLTLHVEKKGDMTLVVLRGRLIAGVNDAVYGQIRPLMPEARRIVLDLGEVTQMDSMGLGALVRLYVSGKTVGTDVELMHLGKRIREILGITHLLDVFTIIGEHGVHLKL
jgi:anti-sigma B factor antagonist